MGEKLIRDRYKGIYIVGNYPEKGHYVAEIPIWGNSLKEIKQKIDKMLLERDRLEKKSEV
jgi:hypothetical protein